MANKKNKKKQTKNTQQRQQVVVEGVPLWIDTAALDDIEILEQLAAASDGSDPFAIVKVMQSMLGTRGYQRAKEHCRDKTTGRTSASKLADFFARAMQAAVPNSNSSQHS